MHKILALDVGIKRVGTAIYDDLTQVSRPYKLLLRAKGEAERELCKIVAEGSFSTIIAGMPFNEDGSRSEQCDDVERFCRRIERRCNVKFQFVDEYGSSYSAQEMMNDAQVSAAKKIGSIDCLAAKVILDAFLQSSDGRRDS